MNLAEKNMSNLDEHSIEQLILKYQHFHGQNGIKKAIQLKLRNNLLSRI